MERGRDRAKAVLFDFGGTLVDIDNAGIPPATKRVLEDCALISETRP